MGAVSSAAKAKQKASQLRIAASPYGKYTSQKGNAKARGIEFTLTFPEWWSLWGASGKWGLRGKSADCYCMSRKNDSGGYTPGNVVIASVRANIKEQLTSGKHISVRLDANAVALVFKLWSEGHTKAHIGRVVGVGGVHIARLLSGERGAYL